MMADTINKPSTFIHLHRVPGNMYVYIKNMVCVRCKMAVQSVLNELRIPWLDIQLCKVQLAIDLDISGLEKLNAALLPYQLELLENPKQVLVERIKTAIIELLQMEDCKIKFSVYLSQRLHYDYTYLSNTYSELEGSTIEKFFIIHKIERAKELMIYENLSAKEIAYRLNYSSVSHLSLQFKKITGQTPAGFKRLAGTPQFQWNTG